MAQKKNPSNTKANLSLIISIVSLLCSLGIAIYTQLFPDIRSTNYFRNTKNYKMELPDKNYERFELEFQIGYRNHGLKTGYIDKVELVPDSRITLRPILLYADKTLLKYDKETIIKVVAIFEVEKSGAGFPTMSTFRLYDSFGRVVTSEKDQSLHTIGFELSPTNIPK